MAKYKSWATKLKNSNVQPIVTLDQFTDPLSFTDIGGFSIFGPVEREAWTRYVTYVVEQLKDVVDVWNTVNEYHFYPSSRHFSPHPLGVGITNGTISKNR